MRGMHVQPVLCEPKCQLGTHLHAFVYNWPREVFEPRASLRQTLQATTELGIGPGGVFSLTRTHSIARVSAVQM